MRSYLERVTKDSLNLIYNSNLHLEPRRLQEHISPILNKIFRPQAMVFYSTNNTDNRILLTLDHVVAINWDNKELTEYADYYRFHDPHFTEVVNSDKIIFQTSDIIPISHFEKLEFYNNYLRPKKCLHALYLCLRTAKKLYGYICMARSKKFCFNRSEMSLAKTLIPHITNALRNAILFSEKNKEAKLFNLIEDIRQEGIMVLDTELKPVYFNSKALELCKYLSNKVPKSDISISENNYIPSCIIKHCKSFASTTRNARDNIYYHHNVIYSADNCIIYVEYYFVWDTSVHSNHKYYVLVLKKIPLEEYPYDNRNLRLTDRELDIINNMCNGLTNKEIADKLFLSKFTIETHLKNIYIKTGARNRVELISRLLGISKHINNISN